MGAMMAEADIKVLITVPFPDSLVERLSSVSPRLKIQMDPARNHDELADDLLQEIQILYTARALPEPDRVPELRWIQFHFAGIDHVADHPLVNSEDILVTTLSGAAVSQMAEFAFMGMLALGRKLLPMMRDKAQKRWAENRFDRFTPLELRDSTVGIVGYGSVGREIARLAREFGAEVLAVKRDLMNLEQVGYTEEGTGDPQAELVHRIYPPQAVGSMAEICDFLLVAVPLTSQTRGMIGTKVFKRMKDTSYLVDISRGGVVDHGALVEALQESWIAGAALDVYPVEPLPESSPLWEMPNVILSPHVAGASPRYFERAADMFATNLRRYLSEQRLLNLYDPDKGY